MNQAIRDRFYSQGNKKHVEYVIRTSGMNDQEEPIAELEKYTMSKRMSKIKNILVFKTFLQPVNLLRFASMVRIRPPTPMEKVLEPLRFLGFFFFYCRGLGVIKSTKKYYKNILFGCQKDVRRMSGFERHACGLTWYF